LKTIDLAIQSSSVQELLDLATEGNLILKTSDGKEFLLAEADDFDREIAMIRQQPELMDLLDRRSNPGATLTLDQVRAELGLD
jgi:ABC-type methionine transport system ATPase subunit